MDLATVCQHFIYCLSVVVVAYGVCEFYVPEKDMPKV